MSDIQAIASRLTNSDPAVRLGAAERLARAGVDAAVAAVPLVKACGDNNEQVRDWCVAALEELGTPPPESTSDLAALASHSNPLVAYWAVTLLGRLGGAAVSAVPVLIACIGERVDAAVAQRAAWALGHIGPAAAAAIAPLRAAALRDDPCLARLAATALNAIEE